jgi:3',5'-cyclic AMP phosphodiesterase CpdA
MGGEGAAEGKTVTAAPMSFTIAHISDAHLGPAPMPRLHELTAKRFMGYVNWKRGRERLNDMAMLARLVDDMLAQKPDHIAVTGDLVNIALDAEFERAAKWMEGLGNARDVSFTPGNHDAYVQAAMPGLARVFAPWTTSDHPRGETFPFLRVRGGVALIGLSSGVPTAPFMATGTLGPRQLHDFGDLLRQTAAQGLARVVLIHHPPLSRGSNAMRSLTDAREFERLVRAHGAEAILHGHTHKRLVHAIVSPEARTVSGDVPVLGAPSAAADARNLSERAAYHLVRVERVGDRWRLSARSRGLLPGSSAIGEREPLTI